MRTGIRPEAVRVLRPGALAGGPADGALLPAALLAGLIVLQTVGGAGGTFTLDARLAALGVAVLLLWRGANFLLVVAAAAVTAALLRLAGWA